MAKPFSVAFKHKMVQRLTGNNAVSASQLARETGVRQQNLSRWLQEARSVLIMADKPKQAVREWTVEQKARVLAEASKLDGQALTTYLQQQEVRLAEYEQWRLALDEGGRASASTTKRIRQLEREFISNMRDRMLHQLTVDFSADLGDATTVALALPPPSRVVSAFLRSAIVLLSSESLLRLECDTYNTSRTHWRALDRPTARQCCPTFSAGSQQVDRTARAETTRTASRV